MKPTPVIMYKDSNGRPHNSYKKAAAASVENELRGLIWEEVSPCYGTDYCRHRRESLTASEVLSYITDNSDKVIELLKTIEDEPGSTNCVPAIFCTEPRAEEPDAVSKKHGIAGALAGIFK